MITQIEKIYGQETDYTRPTYKRRPNIDRKIGKFS